MFRDDADDDSYFIAEQVKAEKLGKQEEADYNMAIRLSNQDSPRPGPSSSGETSAYTRIMNSQLPRAIPSGTGNNTNAGQLTVPKLEPTLISNPESLQQTPGAYGSLWGGQPVPYSTPARMPGTYDSRWDDAFDSDFMPASAIARRSGVHNVHHHRRTSGPVFVSPSMPGLSGGLSDIISRTSALDYSTYTNPNGDAFDERLSNFLQDAYHDPRITEQDLDNLLKNIRPDQDIPEMNRDGTPAGLQRPLYPHQEVALTWMKKMEEGTNKGGILADDMGLGKTISTLALLLSRPATSRPKVKRPGLISKLTADTERQISS